MGEASRAVAVFDLDGTITRHDSLFPYVCAWLARRPLALLRLAALIGPAVRYAVDRDRAHLKVALLRVSMRGITRAELAAWNATYLPRVVEGDLIPLAVAAIAQHRKAGDHLILMSASVDLYVPDLGALLGFDETICTGVRWSAGRLEGDLVTENCRGEEKARCFAEIRKRFEGSTITAYGNADSDLPHLRLADHGVLVNGKAAARTLADSQGVECRTWPLR